MTPVLSALLAAAAVLVLTQRSPAAARLAPSPARPPSHLAAAAVLAALTLGPAAALALLAAAAAYRRHAASAAATRAARANAAALPPLCRALAAELRAGAPPATALARVAADAPPALAAHLARLDGSPPPGAEHARALAALLTLAAGAGTGLADGCDRLADALAAAERRRADLHAQLAGPRASAVVLAALPGIGLALGAALGSGPLRFLATPPGVACLTAAVTLDVLGLLWVRRLTTP